MKLILISSLLISNIITMPKDYDEKLWCNTCQAISREILKIIDQKKSEMYVDDALAGLCTPSRFGVYEYPPPQM